MHFEIEAKKFSDADRMAAAYLANYFKNRKIEYPINPFQMLKDEGILFSLMNFKNLEGVYIPADGEDDLPIVGINVNRPMQNRKAQNWNHQNSISVLSFCYRLSGLRASLLQDSLLPKYSGVLHSALFSFSWRAFRRKQTFP